ncbi:hypothetical protein [Sphingopyxis macrogoltabida]|uniref:hypothetical protein n=1 Tax=Sphingopyxis macrogoltabida TaxID=33050 RepID=UPI0006ED1C47|nr:hypothetical protein [Sphingopyxis macrogoltabida]ALJ12625.1 IncI1 plasmid conjugative transfer inner membrane protein PilR [Sphingopyxis macrogoltabida]
MKDCAIIIGTLCALSIVSGLFGQSVSLWLASVLLAFSVGVLWGAGNEIGKQRNGGGK